MALHLVLEDICAQTFPQCSSVDRWPHPGGTAKGGYLPKTVWSLPVSAGNPRGLMVWLWKWLTGLDINVCPVPVKTDVGQVDLVLWLFDGISEKNRDSQTCRYDGQIYFHWYKILGLLYERALFDLQFVHNLFWLNLKINGRSKLFYCIIYSSFMLWWSSRTLTKLKSQSQKRFNEQKY